MLQGWVELFRNVAYKWNLRRNPLDEVRMGAEIQYYGSSHQLSRQSSSASCEMAPISPGGAKVTSFKAIGPGH